VGQSGEEKMVESLRSIKEQFEDGAAQVVVFLIGVIYPPLYVLRGLDGDRFIQTYPKSQACADTSTDWNKAPKFHPVIKDHQMED